MDGTLIAEMIVCKVPAREVWIVTSRVTTTGPDVFLPLGRNSVGGIVFGCVSTGCLCEPLRSLRCLASLPSGPVLPGFAIQTLRCRSNLCGLLVPLQILASLGRFTRFGRLEFSSPLARFLWYGE